MTVTSLHWLFSHIAAALQVQDCLLPEPLRRSAYIVRVCRF
jgi:hypothetical protein